jgi:beta-glucosidase
LLVSAELPLYKTPGAPVDSRVNDLVKRMNIDEKVNQLVLPFGAKFPQDYQGFNKSGLGGSYPLTALPGEQWWETRNNWQRNAVENTRLGIPTSFIEETLHSSGNKGKGTNFPMPCLQGSTWNQELVQSAAEVIALEASVAGIDRGFSPVLHFCTDPRFGRCEESFSEDPYIVSTMGVAATTGLAGPGAAGAASTYLPEPDRHIATEAKHYAAYAYCGRDGGCPAEISQNTLYDVYLKPWYKVSGFQV